MSLRRCDTAGPLEYFMDRRIAGAQRMCDAENRLAILISASKINTLSGCEYPTAPSSHSDHLWVLDYNRGVSLTT